MRKPGLPTLTGCISATLLSVVLYGNILYRIGLVSFLDYEAHAQFAAEAFQTGKLAPSHIGYLLQVFLAKLFIPGQGWVWALVIVSLVATASTTALVFLSLKSFTGSELSSGVLVVISAVTLSLMFIAPATVLTLPLVRNLYWSVPHPNPFHSPTTTAVKPWALAATMLAMLAFRAGEYQPLSARHKTGIIAGTALVTACMTLTKPSYTIVLLPGMVLAAACFFWRNRGRIWWPMLVFGIIGPSVIILLWQYIGVYIDDGLYGPNSAGGIGFAFPGAWSKISLRIHTPVFRYRIHLLINFVTAYLFPVVTYLAYWHKARKHVRLNVVWVVTIIATVIGLTLVETGPRFGHGNFIWGNMIALFILYVYSAGFVLEQIYVEGKLKFTKRAIAVTGVYLLHIISGIIWYMVHLNISTVVDKWY